MNPPIEEETESKELNTAWYFTFACGHSKLSNNYVRIYGTYSGARAKLQAKVGKYFAFQYDEQNFLPQIKMYGLVEIELEDL